LTARLARALVLVAALWAVVALIPHPAIAADAIEVVSARLEPAAGSEGWVLSASFDIPLPSSLEEAVSRGVPLYFVVEFELVRPRWYWWDERSVEARQVYRLSYHALTRQYRVALNGLQQSFGTLADAIASMSRVRWTVMEPTQVNAGSSYEAQVRMRLDVSQLPKPFQVTAITNRDWTLQAEWKRFKFVP
jgi:hypothetical protein